MQSLSALLSCLLSLFGGAEGQTRLTFASGQGLELLLSRTSLAAGQAATFHCLSSRTGACHYLLYEEQCEAVPSGPVGHCVRRELRRFDLAVGVRRQVPGLPGRFSECVGAGPERCS